MARPPNANRSTTTSIHRGFKMTPIEVAILSAVVDTENAKLTGAAAAGARAVTDGGIMRWLIREEAVRRGWVLSEVSPYVQVAPPKIPAPVGPSDWDRLRNPEVGLRPENFRLGDDNDATSPPVTSRSAEKKRGSSSVKGATSTKAAVKTTEKSKVKVVTRSNG